MKNCLHTHASHLKKKKKKKKKGEPGYTTNALHLNAVLQMDPTRTVTLRRAFAAEATRRFRAIKALIWKSVVTNDALALLEPVPLFPRLPPQVFTPFTIDALSTNEALPRRAFEFRTDPQKVAGFMEWLNLEVNEAIFQVEGPIRAVTGNVAWANVYIDSAYKKGIARANVELEAAGVITPSIIPVNPNAAVEAAFLRPFHADKVGLIYTRVYSDLKGISDSMEQIITTLSFLSRMTSSSYSFHPRTDSSSIICPIRLASSPVLASTSRSSGL